MTDSNPVAAAIEDGFRKNNDLPEPQQLRSELRTLLNLLAKREPETIVEVGTASGGTFRAFCALQSVDLAVSIDLPDVAPTGAELRSLTDDTSVRSIRGDSQSVETKQSVTEVLDGRDVDALLIDADHSYDSVAKDYDLYAPLVGDDGLVFVHDIVVHNRTDEIKVDEFWADLTVEGTKATIVDREYGPPFVERDGWDIVAHGFGVVDRQKELRNSIDV